MFELHSFLSYSSVNPESNALPSGRRFSKKITSDIAASCRTDEESEDCFGTAYNYGRDHVTRLTHEIIRLQRESGLSRKEIVESIKDLASHMNALSYVFLVAADVAEKSLDHD